MNGAVDDAIEITRSEVEGFFNQHVVTELGVPMTMQLLSLSLKNLVASVVANPDENDSLGQQIAAVFCLLDVDDNMIILSEQLDACGSAASVIARAVLSNETVVEFESWSESLNNLAVKEGTAIVKYELELVREHLTSSTEAIPDPLSMKKSPQQASGLSKSDPLSLRSTAAETTTLTDQSEAAAVVVLAAGARGVHPGLFWATGVEVPESLKLKQPVAQDEQSKDRLLLKHLAQSVHRLNVACVFILAGWCRKVFKLVDTDDSGAISKGEFLNCLGDTTVGLVLSKSLLNCI